MQQVRLIPLLRLSIKLKSCSRISLSLLRCRPRLRQMRRLNYRPNNKKLLQLLMLNSSSWQQLSLLLMMLKLFSKHR